MLGTVGAAIALFAATNIDDIFVLLGFLADPKFRARQVIVGQYLGMVLLVAASVVASLVSLVLPPAHVRLLGMLPILIGLKKLYDLRRVRRDHEREGPKSRLGNVLVVAAVTVANGGDNIGVYTPVFATSTGTQIGIFVTVFAAMVGIWIVLAHRLVNHPSLGAPIRRYAHLIVPFVLIAIGVLVLHGTDPP